jgi:hypothetical protein
MDLLGFSSEELEKINSGQPSKTRSADFIPTLEPEPDLSPYSDLSKQKYQQARDSESYRLKARYYNQHPPSFPNEKSLSSQLPRIQKFVKKLKTLADDSKDELLKEASELSLKKFISEAAHSLSENKMQLKDLPAIVDVCGRLHQQHPDFLKAFEANLKRQHKEGDLLRKRNVLRLIVELICFGLWSDLAGFSKVVKEYVKCD